MTDAEVIIKTTPHDFRIENRQGEALYVEWDAERQVFSLLGAYCPEMSPAVMGQLFAWCVSRDTGTSKGSDYDLADSEDA